MTPSSKNAPVALITGASRGIGAAIARQLASLGYRLSLVARDKIALQALSEELSALGFEPAQIIVQDLRVPNAAEASKKVIQQVVSHWHALDVLINNAGVAPKIGLLQEMTEHAIEQTLDLNLKVPLYLMQEALRVMVQQSCGTILNLNSVAGKTAYPFWAVYDASKFALRALTQAVCEEARSNGIRVCGIYPAATDTAIWDDLDLQQAPDRQGMLTPVQVAEAVAFMVQQPPEVLISELTIQPLKPAL
ncbi:MAG: SDR family NAD(P)-dependent oxidoreductase [Vampirovibrionales bacterium]|nr:SDR family NAD(P)-dependent oxidoreductase [Vampirovibrionales bacterium]